MKRPDWDQYALGLALAASVRSEDPYHKIGAVVLRRDRSVLGVGYNGAPAGIVLNWQDRESRRPLVIHAETNALRYANPGTARGGLLAVTGTPCPNCLTNAAAHGIKRVVFGDALDGNPLYPIDEANRIAVQLGLDLVRL